MYMLTEEEIQQFGDLIDTKLDQKLDQKLEPINKKLDNLTLEISHIKTAIKYLPEEDDIELHFYKVTSEILAVVYSLRAKLLQVYKTQLSMQNQLTQE